MGELLDKLAALQITVRVEDVRTLVRAASEAGWSAVDSGLRVTTEDGVDREAVVVLRIPVLQEDLASAAG